MGKIFCLMGKSSSGKDTIFKKIKQNKNLKLKTITTYTTRPRRNNEKNGVEYYFIDKNRLDSYGAEKKIIEVREYDTINGKWYYSTIDDGQINLNRNSYILISTLQSYNSLQNYFGKDNIVPLYVDVDDGVRLERALKRERLQRKPNYEEVCRRFLADSNDFSEEKLVKNNIKKYRNDNLKYCTKQIMDTIKSYMDI